MITVEETAVRLWLSGDPADLTALYDHFKFRPPDYWRSPSYMLWKRTKGRHGWDGYLSRVQSSNGRKFMLRGHRDDLLEYLSSDGVEHKVKSLQSPFAALTVDDLPDKLLKAGFDLDIHQRECVTNLLRHGFGTVKMTVSGGKTAVLFSVFAMIRRTFPTARALYITPSERLVRQVTVEGRKFLPDLEVTQFGGGKRDRDGKDVVVATAAAINANFDELKESSWFKSFMVVIYDECQFAGSPTSEKLLKEIPAFFRFGASDTVKDERKEDVVRRWKIQGLLGPPRAEIGVTPLIDVGRVAKPHIHLIDDPSWSGIYDDIPHLAEPGTPAWAFVGSQWHKGTYIGPAWQRDETTGNLIRDKFGNQVQLDGYHTLELDGEQVEVESRWCLLRRAYDVAITNNKARNKLAIDWAAHFAGKGWPTLVVATRTLHVHILATMAEDRGLVCETLTGEDSSKERDRVFTWLVEEPGRVLISPLVKIGVSIPQLRGGVIADYVGSADLSRQIIGRFIRKKPTGDNNAHVAWFVDRQVASMRAGSLSLFRELERIRGYRFYHPCKGPNEIGPLFEAASAD